MSNHLRPYLAGLLALTGIALLLWGLDTRSADRNTAAPPTETTSPYREPGNELELRIDRHRLRLERNQFERNTILLEAEVAALEAKLGALEATQTPATSETSTEHIDDTPPPPGTNADLDAQWFAAYQAAGGRNTDIFRDIILPCESGGQPLPHIVVGPTDDWGRAQINRPTWKATFEDRYSVDFETNIVDPSLNGHFAAYIEQVQGLDAWTCYR